MRNELERWDKEDPSDIFKYPLPKWQAKQDNFVKYFLSKKNADWTLLCTKWFELQLPIL